MKHVIIIETVDDGRKIDAQLEAVLMRAVEIGVEEAHGPCAVYGRFNVPSAIAATHEIYGAPEWTGGA